MIGGQSPQNPGEHSSPDAAKVALRDQLLTARRRLGLVAVAEAAEAIADRLLDAPEIRRAATVAAYCSVGSEPGTTRLIDALTGLGKRVILPVLMADNDLDWAAYDGHLSPAGRGLLEPDGPRLGPQAVATADAVIVPALAVSATGMRMGRGGGSYDRALARVPVGTFVCALAYDCEVGIPVPTQAHDRGVTAVASPGGIVRFAPTF